MTDRRLRAGRESQAAAGQLRGGAGPAWLGDNSQLDWHSEEKHNVWWQLLLWLQEEVCRHELHRTDVSHSGRLDCDGHRLSSSRY